MGHLKVQSVAIFIYNPSATCALDLPLTGSAASFSWPRLSLSDVRMWPFQGKSNTVIANSWRPGKHKRQATSTQGIRKDCLFRTGACPVESPPKTEHLTQALLVFYTFVLLRWAGLVQSSFWFLAACWYKRWARLQKPKACKGSIWLPTSGCPFLSAFYQLSFSLPALDFQAAVADLEKISFGGQGTLCCHRRWEGDRDHSVFFLLDRDVEGSNVTARVLRHPKESSDS